MSGDIGCMAQVKYVDEEDISKPQACPECIVRLITNAACRRLDVGLSSLTASDVARPAASSSTAQQGVQQQSLGQAKGDA